MPHYHIVEATKAVKPVLGDYFVEPEKSGPIPFHLIKRFFQGAEVGTLRVGDTRGGFSLSTKCNPVLLLRMEKRGLCLLEMPESAPHYACSPIRTDAVFRSLCKATLLRNCLIVPLLVKVHPP